MGSALSAGVTGLKAHQAMLDIAGNNLANMNTTAYKSSSVTFSELLSQTIQSASSPSGSLGGTNPQQMGGGVDISSIRKDMTQGTIESTGQDLDMAIDGNGYFVLNNGSQNVYTRIGSFAVDSDNTLVDPATGYVVQRTGTAGESEGFQTAGDTSIHIPWDAAMPANATSSVTMNGNLRSEADASQATYHKLVADTAFTTGTSGTTAAQATTLIDDLYQWDGTFGAGDDGTLTVSGVLSDGSTTFTQSLTLTQGSGQTMQDVLDEIETGLGGEFTASLNSSGEIVITANDNGYNQATITGFSYTAGTGTSALTTPSYFSNTVVGGEDTQTFKMNVYDSMGEAHVMTGVFAKTDTTNTWDLVIQSITGENDSSWSSYDIHNPTDTTFNRRISGIEFNTDGSIKGLNSTSETLDFAVQFENNPSVTQTITLDLGSDGEFTGLTQFDSQSSSASALSQDGYSAGNLSSVSVDNSGLLVGTFTNGVKADIATIQIGLFQNPDGLESVGDGYYLPSSNSGEALATSGGTGGAGYIQGKSLEQSNVDVATEFVKLMNAQNGYQANSRTITVANDVLQELTNLIR